MPHWLADITKLFTCETTDLVELARVVGYEDAEDFYRGTLSEFDIDRRITNPRPPTSEMVVQFDGNLGLCLVNVSDQFLRGGVLRAPALLFADVTTLISDFLRGNLNRDFTAVMRLTDLNVTPFLNLLDITPVLEVLRAQGFSVAMVCDANLLRQPVPLPVASDFPNGSGPNELVSLIATGDVIEFDFERRTLKILTGEPLEGREPQIVVSSIPAQDGMLALRESEAPLSIAEETILFGAANIHALWHALSQVPRRQRDIVNAYLRMFHALCQEFVEELSRQGSMDRISRHPAMNGLSEVLVLCSKRAFKARMFETCEVGVDAAMKLSSEVFDGWAGAPESDAMTLIGDLHLARNEVATAIRWFQAALSAVGRDIAGTPLPSTVNERAAALHRRLGSAYRRFDRLDNAMKEYDQANYRLHDLAKSSGQSEAYYMLAQNAQDIASVALAADDLATARNSISEAIDAFSEAFERGTNDRRRGALAKVYSRAAEIYLLSNEPLSALICSMSAALLRLQIYALRGVGRRDAALNSDVNFAKKVALDVVRRDGAVGKLAERLLHQLGESPWEGQANAKDLSRLWAFHDEFRENLPALVTFHGTIVDPEFRM